MASSTPARQPQSAESLEQRQAKRIRLRHSDSQYSPGMASHRQSQNYNHLRSQQIASSEADFRAEDDVTIQEREDADSLNEIIMCTDMRDRGTVGCCYYVARDERVFVMSDVTYGGVEVIKTCELNRMLKHYSLDAEQRQ